MGPWGKSIPDRGNSQCIGPEVWREPGGGAQGWRRRRCQCGCSQVERGRWSEETDKAPIRPHEALGSLTFLNMYEREAAEASLGSEHVGLEPCLEEGMPGGGGGPAGSLLRETRLALAVQC